MSQTPSCRACGVSLAPDQRYCLACGTRSAPPRLDFVAESERVRAEVAGGAAATVVVAAPAGAAVVADAAPPAGAALPAADALPAVAPSPAVAAPSQLDRIGGPMGVAAVVLVALGIGFLVGQTRHEAPVAQRAPVVTIDDARASGEAAAETPAAETPAAEATVTP